MKTSDLIKVCVAFMFVSLFLFPLINSETLDQEQSAWTSSDAMLGNYDKAQSFIPDYNEITKVSIYLYKLGNTSSTITVYIKDALTGTTLGSSSKCLVGGSWNWENFTFSSAVEVTSGVEHFIVLHTNATIVDYYAVAYQNTDVYADGTYYHKTGGVWYQDSTYDMSFRTYRPDSATVVTNATTSITMTSARLNGYLSDTGDSKVCTLAFVYDTSSHASWSSYAFGPYTYGTVNSTQTFHKDIYSLNPGQTYHFRTVVENGYGISQSADDTFITLSVTPPAVSTGGSYDIEATSAWVWGSLTDLGNDTYCKVKFVYDESSHASYADYPNSTTWSYLYSTTSFQMALSGLKNNTTYHFRAVANNTDSTVAGSDDSFTTDDFPDYSAPSVTTDEATDFGYNCSILHGTLTDLGNASSVQLVFSYGIGNYTNNVTVGNYSGSVPYSFYYGLSGLTSGVTYHYVARALTASYGNATGEDSVFTTDACDNIKIYYEETGELVPNIDMLNLNCSLYVNETRVKWVEGNPCCYSFSGDPEYVRLQVTETIGATNYTFSRTMIPNDTGNISFYIPDDSARTTYYTFTISDMSGLYGGSYLQVYTRDESGVETVIHEDYWGSESSCLVWLIYDHTYLIRIVKGATTADLGKITADSETDKSITILPVSEAETYTLWSMIKYVAYHLVNSDNVSDSDLIFTYNDLNQNTTYANITITEINGTTETAIYWINFTSDTYYISRTVNASREHRIWMNVTHLLLGSVSQIIIVYPEHAKIVNRTWLQSFLEDKIGATSDLRILDMITFIFCIIALMVFGKSHAGLGITLSGGVYGAMCYIIGISLIDVTVLILLIVFGMMLEIMSGGRGR